MAAVAAPGPTVVLAVVRAVRLTVVCLPAVVFNAGVVFLAVVVFLVEAVVGRGVAVVPFTCVY